MNPCRFLEFNAWDFRVCVFKCSAYNTAITDKQLPNKDTIFGIKNSHGFKRHTTNTYRL